MSGKFWEIGSASFHRLQWRHLGIELEVLGIEEKRFAQGVYLFISKISNENRKEINVQNIICS
jgi:hypothetical protein